MKATIYLLTIYLIGLCLISCSKKNEPKVCYNIVSVSGSGQQGAAGQKLPQPLKVKVTDPNGRLAANVEVWWFVNYGGGTANPEFSKTDHNGIASTEWTLGTEGDQNVNAIVNGLSFECTSGQDVTQFGATLN